MKRILTLSLILALSTGISFGATNYGKSLKNAVKQDIQATKDAVKKDADEKAKANQSANEAKKAEKIKQIDEKIDALNKEKKNVQNSKTMTETEKTIKTRSLERQIEFYEKQKAALK